MFGLAGAAASYDRQRDKVPYFCLDLQTGKVELIDREVMTRIIGGYQTLDEVKAQVRRMLPAHLEVEFDIGVLTWGMVEAIGRDFAAWDSRDVTWEWFDLNGEKLGGE